MSEYFEGRYFKHQQGDETIALIPGRCEDSAFVQMIAKNRSHYFSYPLREYQKSGGTIRVGENAFAGDGIFVDINRDQTKIAADIRYGPLTPIRSDIMGPFRFFPMQCRHGILSMRHDLNGWVRIDGQTIDFTGGTGYIEEDSGNSFPSEYLWFQCNEKDCSLMLAVADIPFGMLRFQGCICAIHYQGAEYRLATYRGVNIVQCDPEKIILQQGKYRLKVEILASNPQPLPAPQKGKMSRTIKECVSCYASFTFYERDHALFQLQSSSASFECVRRKAEMIRKNC